ncbi:Bro-N domain-containing protein [Priestia flexa]|uniref:BRO-N domain-containing protein n=1 Tax=Priestia flexa TaxID=86664 RepID=UPI000473ACC6|nr:Bro-N domain-containing protein [Priestia flexa]
MNGLKVIDEREVLGKCFTMYGSVDNPLFLAKDVAEWIDYSMSNGKYKVSQMLKTVDEDEKLVATIKTPGMSQYRDMYFLTEDGLYEVLMQSRKTIAKEFKKEVKKILKTIRKTGGYVSNADMMVNTYFGALDDGYKATIKGLFINIEEQQKQLQAKDREISHKENVIIGLVDEIGLAEKRQIINRVVRKGNKKYSDRWNALYREFEAKYHINIKRRLEKYNEEHKPKLKNKLDYIDKVLNKIPELYEVAAKLYENDVKSLVQEMYELNT